MKIMPLAPIPPHDEIVRLYETGELSAELTQHHEPLEEGNDSFVQRCIALHNDGIIDLISVPSQLTFAGVTGPAFFTAQNLYCEAIPKLRTTAMALMECCRILVERAGADGAATLPNEAFRAWCQINPSEVGVVVHGAQIGDELAKRFVVFALQASNDIESAVYFVLSYTDDRRVSGMIALAGMIFPDAVIAQNAIRILEPFVANGSSDHVRSHALLATFNLVKKYNDAETAKKLVEAAIIEPGPETLAGLAQVLWLDDALLNDQALRAAMLALEAVDPLYVGTVRILDMTLRRLLGTKGEALALDFLTSKLQEGKLSIESFEITAQELSRGNPNRLYELVVRWFLSGSIALCNNVSELIGVHKDCVFDSNVQSIGLTPIQQIFLCRKAIGFLFTKPVICTSILVSVLRAKDEDTTSIVAELLFDPILLSYGGEAKEYLKHIPATDPAYGPIQTALSKDEDFYAGLNATGTIKELHPSDHQRDVVRQRDHEEMRTVRKMVETKSVLLSLVRRSTLLYGRRSLTYITDDDGSQRSVAMDLKSHITSFELPRREILDPVGLDHMLRVYRVEKLK